MVAKKKEAHVDNLTKDQKQCFDDFETLRKLIFDDSQKMKVFYYTKNSKELAHITFYKVRSLLRLTNEMKKCDKMTLPMINFFYINRPLIEPCEHLVEINAMEKVLPILYKLCVSANNHLYCCSCANVYYDFLTKKEIILMRTIFRPFKNHSGPITFKLLNGDSVNLDL